MAQLSERQRHQTLRGLLQTAIEDAAWGMDEEIYHYLIFVSEDLEEVVVFVNQSDAEQAALIEEYIEWNVETATNYDDAVGVADLYSDLR